MPRNDRESQLSRRRLLAAAGLAAVPTAGELLGPTRSDAAPARVTRPLPRVEVSPDRVIRTLAGLRPYRPSGFVVKAEKLGEKRVVHNYGHGGGGVTLSWGTAQLAVEEALAAGPNECAVLGCGAVGLATARLLQNRGVRVSLYAKSLPPDTTSNAAAAMWFPVSVYDEHDPQATTPAFREQFARACRSSHHFFQQMAGDRYGIRWIPTYFLFQGKPDALDWPGGRDLYPALSEETDGILTAPFAVSFSAIQIQTPIYLNAVLRDFYQAGGQIVVRDFRTREDVARLPEPVIVNCTGLGSRELFGDRELRPVKGQIAILLPQPETDYAYVQFSRDNLLYMFPRKDGILLGGTEEEGNSSLEPDPKQTARILAGHAALQGASGA